MTYGIRRDRSLRVRTLDEEDDAARYQREGWDPRKTEEENLGYEGLFDRPDEDFEGMAQTLAAEGRGHDTEVAHVARGELVVPRALQNPEVLAALHKAAARYNVPLEMLSVGNALNRINPATGAPEFWFDQIFSSLSDREPRQTDLPDIQAPGKAPPYEAKDPGMGTIRLPTDPSPSYEHPPAPGIGAMPLPTSEYAPHLRPGKGAFPYSGDPNQNDRAFEDFNPLQMSPVPFTGFTPSGSIRDRTDKNGNPVGHYGVDFAVPPGTPVVAAADGEVVNISPLPNYGNQVAIKHANGITTQVAHLDSINVKVGDKVKAGQAVGISGDGSNRAGAGNARGEPPQVHFEVRGGNGQPSKNGGIIYNPLPFLRGRISGF